MQQRKQGQKMASNRRQMPRWETKLTESWNQAEEPGEGYQGSGGPSIRKAKLTGHEEMN